MQFEHRAALFPHGAGEHTAEGRQGLRPIQIRVPDVRATRFVAEAHRLRAVSRIMVDKTTTVRREAIGERVGRLADEDVVRLNRAILVLLGLADRAS